jgi:hypothetical protein
VGDSASQVAYWSISKRLVESARRATLMLPEESRDQFAALFSPLNIEITGAVLAAWGASHLIGVGEVADVVLVGIGVVTMGTAAFGVGRDLGTYLSIAANAQIEADLDRAAGYLARAVVTMGVLAFVALIMKAGSRLRGAARAAAAEQSALELDLLAEQMLEKVFGSTKNVGKLPRQNMRTIVEFFEKRGVEKGKDLGEWVKLLKGIDLHAIKPVRVVRFNAGDLVGEYVETGRPADRQIGQWMVRLQGGVSDRNLGLSSAGRTWKLFRVIRPVEVLESRAAPAADHWTEAGAKPHTAIVGQSMVPAEQVSGGGQQYFMPRAWEYLEENR